MKKFTFSTAPSLEVGIERLSSLLGFEIGGGMSVRAVACDKIGVKISGNEATIYYIKPHHFFRQLGILLEHSEEEFYEAYEDTYFGDVIMMLAVSSGSPPSLQSLLRLTDYLALMGYNGVMLSMESMIELKGRPHYGYMRGRYTEEELRALDDYAADYGIEVMACIACYGHNVKYLTWDEAEPLRDTGSVFLARSEETFKFLDELIGTASRCLRSRRVNVCMDEAWDMGRGKFLDEHGYVKPIDIFNEYMGELSSILEKYNYDKPMMWSDMYFRASSKSGRDYYAEDTEISELTAKSIPDNMTLVFWHYGEEPGCDEYMIEKHLKLDRPIIFAGGIWDWSGHFPDNEYALKATKESLSACRKLGVKDAMVTAWHKRENILFANLAGFSEFAELCYDANASDEKLRARFEAVSGGSFESFLNMGAFHNKFDGGEVYSDFNDRYLGYALFWQSILSGQYDSNLFESPMSEHYAKYAEIMKKAPQDKWKYIYDFAVNVFEYLSVKTKIAEKLVPAYLAKELDTLAELADSYLPELIEKTEICRCAHRDIWNSTNKPFGWEKLDTSYCAVKANAENAIIAIKRYISGDEHALDELAVPRLYKKLSAFSSYNSIAEIV